MLLTIVGIVLFGKPVLHHFTASGAAAATPPKRATAPAPARKILPRNEVSVMVLNGNGMAGAAHSTADRVQAKGYLLGNVGNAPTITPHTLVMFRPGYVPEGRRLARDLRVRIVRPLDGMRPSQLPARRRPRPPGRASRGAPPAGLRSAHRSGERGAPAPRCSPSRCRRTSGARTPRSRARAAGTSAAQSRRARRRTAGTRRGRA